MLSITEHPIVQKALGKAQRFGTGAAVHLAWMKLVNRFVTFKILRGMHARRPDTTFFRVPAGYSAGFKNAAELARWHDDPACELSAQFARDAFGAGDQCYAIWTGSSLAAYSWYSTRPTPAISPDLLLHFAAGYVYMYKGFTTPGHRGKRLHAIGKTHALRHYIAKGYRGLISYVESTNLESLKSNARMGYEIFGSIYVIKIFGRYFAVSTPGCWRYDFRLERKPAPHWGWRRGKV